MKKLPIIVFIITAIIILIYNGCKDKVTTPPEESKPPGYQEDIPWPSLANSPWPMNHHDAQSTGRINSTNTPIGIKNYEISFAGSLMAGVSIGVDSSIYLVVGENSNANLYCINTSRSIKWSKFFSTLKNSTTPLITSKGRIIVTNRYKSIYSFDFSGNLMWSYEASDAIHNSSISIDLDGNLYFTDNAKKLYVISKEGKFLWGLEDNRIGNIGHYSISFSPDGKTIYIPGSNVTLLAINIINKNIEWIFEGQSTFTTPLVDSYGNIYVINKNNNNSTMISVNKNGHINWKYEFSLQDFYDNSPTIDKNGNIYFAADSIYSLKYDGTLRWKDKLQGSCVAPLICDSKNVYCSVNNIEGIGVSKIAYTLNGIKSWTINDNTQISIAGSSALDGSGNLYFPTYGSKLLIIK